MANNSVARVLRLSVFFGVDQIGTASEARVSTASR